MTIIRVTLIICIIMCTTHYFPSYYVVNMRGFDFPPFLPQNMKRNIKGNIFRCGSIIMCQVQKHGTEIIEIEVWLHFMTC